MINIRIMDYCDMISLYFDRHHVGTSVSEELAASIFRVRKSFSKKMDAAGSSEMCLLMYMGSHPK
jgi:hypothetical protein